jgi:hypothetical protein
MRNFTWRQSAHSFHGLGGDEDDDDDDDNDDDD